tara:strand:+ start:705 stop:1397 length:693 start_codon:yes stop_codon:yes gene_type:complete
VETDKIKIKHWAEDDRPREKLRGKGPSALSDAELIAILLGSGSRNETAVDLAKRILQSVKNNLNELGRLSVEDLLPFKGIGEAKAISIITALELGKRRRLSEALERKKVTSSTEAFEVLQPLIGDLPHEEFWVLFLNSSNHVRSSKSISRGGLTGTMADLRMIFKEALMLNSPAVVLAHNHPSGSVRPSPQDKSLTRKIAAAGNIMDIKIIDHLIITEHQYFSFADEGLL